MLGEKVLYVTVNECKSIPQKYLEPWGVDNMNIQPPIVWRGIEKAQFENIWEVSGMLRKN